MKIVECSRCGSKELISENGFVVCAYCQSQFVPQAEDRPAVNTSIQLESDIDQLLRRCREDPANRRRYANLILDIDPSNAEAHNYLR